MIDSDRNISLQICIHVSHYIDIVEISKCAFITSFYNNFIMGINQRKTEQTVKTNVHGYMEIGTRSLLRLVNSTQYPIVIPAGGYRTLLL
jgi:hypothetical protein